MTDKPTAARARELDSTDRRVASIIYHGIAKAYGLDPRRWRCPNCGGNEQSCQCALEEHAA